MYIVTLTGAIEGIFKFPNFKFSNFEPSGTPGGSKMTKIFFSQNRFFLVKLVAKKSYLNELAKNNPKIPDFRSLQSVRRQEVAFDDLRRSGFSIRRESLTFRLKTEYLTVTVYLQCLPF